MKKISFLILLILSLLLVFYFFNHKDDKKSEKNNSLIIGQIEENKNIKEGNVDLKYNKKEDKLTIGTDVIIEEVDYEIDADLKVYKDSKIYKNSNVRNYFFFVVDKNEKLKDIGEFYISLFSGLGYTMIEDKKEELENSSLESLLKQKNNDEYVENIDETDQGKYGRLEFVLKNEKYKLGEDGFAINGEKEFKQRVLIFIHKETPKNIKEGMGLDGRFVEVYFNQN